DDTRLHELRDGVPGKVARDIRQVGANLDAAFFSALHRDARVCQRFAHPFPLDEAQELRERRDFVDVWREDIYIFQRVGQPVGFYEEARERRLLPPGAATSPAGATTCTAAYATTCTATCTTTTSSTAAGEGTLTEEHAPVDTGIS